MAHEPKVRVRVRAPAEHPPDPGWVSDLVHAVNAQYGGGLVVVQLDQGDGMDALDEALAVAFSRVWSYLEAQGGCDGEGSAEWRRVSAAWKERGRKMVELFILSHCNAPPPSAG